MTLPTWFNEWRHKRQSKRLSHQLHRRLEQAGQVHQLLLNNVKLHERVMESIRKSVQESYMENCVAINGNKGDPKNGGLRTLVVKDCFLRDTATVRELVNLLQSQRGQVQHVTLLHNTLNATHAMTNQQLDSLLEAMGVVKHLKLGSEFGTLQPEREGNHQRRRRQPQQQSEQGQGQKLLQHKACERAITLELVHETDDDIEHSPSEVPAFIRLRGLYQGLQSDRCRVQNLILRGSLLDDRRFALLVDSIVVASSTVGCNPPTHLTLPCGHLHVRSCATMIRLLQHHTRLEHLEMISCAFFAAISPEQARLVGTVLAQHNHLEHLMFRNVYLTDALAVSLFGALGQNQVLQTLDLTTRFDHHHGHGHRFPPVSTTGYLALAPVLPTLQRLTTLRLGRDFFRRSARLEQGQQQEDSNASMDFVSTMKRALYANGSIQVYETNHDDDDDDDDNDDDDPSPSSSLLFGPYESIISYCMKRNRASLVASALLMMMVTHDDVTGTVDTTRSIKLDAPTWHAVLLHMSAIPERQTALYQILQRVLIDPELPLRRRRTDDDTTTRSSHSPNCKVRGRESSNR